MNALADRREDLTGVVGNLNATFGALGRQQDALAESVERLPPFMRRANTTFVNLRSALDDVDPLVDAVEAGREAARAVPRPGAPVRARRRAHDPRPVPDDRGRRAPNNDLIELIQSFPPLAGRRWTSGA